VLAPCDYEQMKKMVLAMTQVRSPVYVRYHKQKLPQVTTAETPFKLGRAQVLREGKDVSVFACGPMVYRSLRVAEKLKSKVDVEVINIHTIKPIDRGAVTKSAKKTGKVVTAEEHQTTGGLGSAVAEVLGENYPTVMRRVGVKDTFAESGNYEELVEKYGVGEKDIERAILDMI